MQGQAACTKKTYHLYRSWALAARLRLPSSGGRSFRWWWFSRSEEEASLETARINCGFLLKLISRETWQTYLSCGALIPCLSMTFSSWRTLSLDISSSCLTFHRCVSQMGSLQRCFFRISVAS